MKKTFVMRGKTVSGGQELLEFGGRQKENKNMAYRLVEFQIMPSTTVFASTNVELSATITAAKTFEDPSNPNFNNQGLIASALFGVQGDGHVEVGGVSIINDTFMITNNLILAVIDNQTGSPQDVNWQCRFEAVKMTDAQTAATNFRQYTIFDE